MFGGNSQDSFLGLAKVTFFPLACKKQNFMITEF
jgi:hypothetical protein